MTLKQFRYLCEIVSQGFHLSQAAEALNTSQPGMTRQIQMLEDEIGVVILRRRRNRILGLTQPGREILKLAEQALQAAASITAVGKDQGHELTQCPASVGGSSWRTASLRTAG